MTTDLDSRLALPEQLDRLGSPDLDAIRRGGKRRRRRRTASLVGVAATVAVLGGVGVVGGQALLADPASIVVDPATRPTPTELSGIARRALAEVPGAVRVSAWQVVITANVPPTQDRAVDRDIVGRTIPLDAGAYTGVTIMPRSAVPSWLFEATEHYERTELRDPPSKDGTVGGYPVGSTDSGVYVDYGTSELACLAPWSSAGEDMPGDTCYPALVARVGDSAYLQWSMGTERFLEPGHGMELFTHEDLSTGEPRTVWIGGIDGTGIERVEFVTAAGETVRATLASGTLVPDETMFWAPIVGTLARVIAYDAGGAVVDEHAIRPCSSGADCEVR